jgi:hypothetical protein
LNANAKENKIGGALDTCRREEKCIDYRISVGKPEGEKGLHNLGMHVKIILQLILKEWMGRYRMGYPTQD